MKRICAIITILITLATSFTAFCDGPTITEPLYGTTADGVKWQYTDTARSAVVITGYDRSLIKESITIPSTITVYSVIMGEKYITSPVIKICARAFSGCDEIKEVNISNGIKEIEYEAFSACDNLEKVVLPETLESVGYNDTVEIHRHDDTAYYPQGSVFEGCDSLKSINIPGSLKNICEWMFAFCPSLETVEMSEGVEEIGENAFYKCNNLKNITLPQSLKSIRRSAFQVSGLTEIVIPSEVTTIEPNAFTETKLTSIVIPESVTTWGSTVLEGSTILLDGSVIPVQEIIIYGVPGSYIHRWYQYLRNKPYTFKPISEYPGNASDSSRTETVCISEADGKKTYSCKPTDLPMGCEIIFACYRGGKMVEIQSAPNTNEMMYFVVDNGFDSAKVMAWESFKNMNSLCAFETVQP